MEKRLSTVEYIVNLSPTCKLINYAISQEGRRLRVQINTLRMKIDRGDVVTHIPKFLERFIPISTFSGTRKSALGRCRVECARKLGELGVRATLQRGVDGL